MNRVGDIQGKVLGGGMRGPCAFSGYITLQNLQGLTLLGLVSKPHFLGMSVCIIGH